MGVLFRIMTYTLTIDMMFAQRHDMTLTEASNLASLVTLPTWSQTIAIDGVIWYKYSERKMVEDYPLLYGNEKRCYKNIKALADSGYIQLYKIGKEKYLRFMPICAEWGRQITEIPEEKQERPKTDCESENGLKDQKRTKKSPKLDSNYNIKDYNIIISKKENIIKEKKTLFGNSRLFDWGYFSSLFVGTFESTDISYTQIDMMYYYHAVNTWSDQTNTMRTERGWKATVQTFIRGDLNKGQLHYARREETESGIDAEAMAYLNGDFGG